MHLHSVKDKDNLFDYNIWTCGEYNNNITGFTNSSNIIVNLTPYPLDIGNTSIKISKTNLSTGYEYLSYVYNLNGLYLNKTATWSFDLLNLTDDSARILLNTGETTSVYVPLSEGIQRVSLSNTITNTRIVFYVSYKSAQIGDYYVSNFQLRI